MPKFSQDDPRCKTEEGNAAKRGVRADKAEAGDDWLSQEDPDQEAEAGDDWRAQEDQRRAPKPGSRGR